MFDYLEECELIKREGDSRDRRKTWVELSEKGKKYTDSQLALYEAGVEYSGKQIMKKFYVQLKVLSNL